MKTWQATRPQKLGRTFRLQNFLYAARRSRIEDYFTTTSTRSAINASYRALRSHINTSTRPAPDAFDESKSTVCIGAVEFGDALSSSRAKAHRWTSCIKTPQFDANAMAHPQLASLATATVRRERSPAFPLPGVAVYFTKITRDRNRFLSHQQRPHTIPQGLPPADGPWLCVAASFSHPTMGLVQASGHSRTNIGIAAGTHRREWYWRRYLGAHPKPVRQYRSWPL